LKPLRTQVMLGCNGPGPRSGEVRGRVILCVLGIGLVVGLAFQGSRGLYETTEARYAESGREMAETGNWLVPQLDYRPSWTKPPLTCWTVAAGIRTLGPSEWGARLANGLTLPVLALVVAWMGTLLFGPAVGAVAGLVYATSLFPVLAASTISTDLLVSLWQALMAATYWQALRRRGGPSEGRWLLALWGAAGLAFLTKGPPALVTLAAILAYQALARRRGWPTVRLRWWPGLLLFALSGLTWYAVVVLSTPGLLRYYLEDEVFKRIATGYHNRNPEWYQPLIVFGLPLGLGLGAWLGTGRSALRGWRELAPPGEAGLLRHWWSRPESAFLLIWLVLPLVVFSLARSRLPFYVLPLFPVPVLLLARGLARAWQARPARKALTTALAVALLLVGVKALSARIASGSDALRLYTRLEADLGPDTPVVVVDESKLFGLQFYLDRPVVRATVKPAEDESPQLTAVLRAQEPGTRTVLLVAQPDERLEGACASSGWTCTELGFSGDYRVLRADAPGA